MPERSKGHAALASYSSDLLGIQIQEREWGPLNEVKRATVFADAQRLRIVVSTNIMGSAARAERVADAAAEAIWWGLQQEIVANLRFATRIVRDAISLSYIDGKGGLSVSATDTSRGSDSSTAVLILSSAAVAAAAGHPVPPPSPAVDMYVDALAERDPVLQFKALFNVAVAASERVLGCDCQVCTDELLLRLEPSMKLVPCPAGREKRTRTKSGHVRDPRLGNQTTEVTSLRNRLDHAHAATRRAQGGWAATTQEIKGVVSQLRTVSVRALSLSVGSVPASTGAPMGRLQASLLRVVRSPARLLLRAATAARDSFRGLLR